MRSNWRSKEYSIAVGASARDPQRPGGALGPRDPLHPLTIQAHRPPALLQGHGIPALPLAAIRGTAMTWRYTPRLHLTSCEHADLPCASLVCDPAHLAHWIEEGWFTPGEPARRLIAAALRRL